MGLVLKPALYSTFICDTDSGIESTLSKFTDDTKVCDAVDTVKGRDGNQRHQNIFERWDCEKLVRFNEVKCKDLCLGWGNPKQKCRLGRELIKSSPGVKDLGVLVDEKYDMTRQCVLAVQKVNCVLGCIKRRLTSRSIEVVLSLYSTLVTPHLEFCVQLGMPPAQENFTPVGVSPEKRVSVMGIASWHLASSTRDSQEDDQMIRVLEHLSHKERQRELRLFILEKTRIQGDLRALISA
ncbi:rna-directed dna polymerase from mobile element jockey-like [Willisornis vidua]|uniref:Rna-directed dna polymerase from mobile element jockey-like n=1 Tax=Willisornis vidua TaxID=1566151 RepID=A0ABQ9CLG5_9PASS|nr:rna-directed dna polymerase from mobile element jockey-like [Willisornis vidua]